MEEACTSPILTSSHGCYSILSLLELEIGDPSARHPPVSHRMSSLPEEPWRMREMLDSRIIVGDTMYQIDPYTHMPIALPAALCAPRPLPPIVSQAALGSLATYPYPAKVGLFVPTGQHVPASQTTQSPQTAETPETNPTVQANALTEARLREMLAALLPDQAPFPGPTRPKFAQPTAAPYQAFAPAEMSAVYDAWVKSQMEARNMQMNMAHELSLMESMATIGGSGGVDVPVGGGQVVGVMPYGWGWFRPN